MMRHSQMSQGMSIALVTIGLICQASPMAWAQLEETDPALHAAVEALIAKDPDVAKDPELATICREVAEATVLDPRERAAVTREVTELHREGIDVKAVIPTEVREAARDEFAKVQGQMKEQLETLRATDPEKAKEVELMMHEGEQCMRAFETGEHYTPSAEMVAHAEGMFKEWESDMVAKGAPPEYVERARMEFAAWSSGDTGGMMGGLGHEMMGPGGPAGHEGGMPSIEQMQQMVEAGQMTPEQLQMAKEYMQAGESFEHYGPVTEQQMKEGFEAWAAGRDPAEVQAAREQMEVMMREHENLVSDTTQQNLFETNYTSGTPPPPGSEVLVAIHDHNNDGIPDEYHYDTNGDGIADHAHSTPH